MSDEQIETGKGNVCVPSSACSVRPAFDDNVTEDSMNAVTESPYDTNADGKKRSFQSESIDEGKKRARRMMGVLLGTLNRFKDELKQPTDAIKRKEQVESKVAERIRIATEEADELARLAREDRQRRIAAAQAQAELERQEMQKSLESSWLQHRQSLIGFLKTTIAKRPVYYAPKQLLKHQLDSLNHCLSPDDEGQQHAHVTMVLNKAI